MKASVTGAGVRALSVMIRVACKVGYVGILG